MSFGNRRANNQSNNANSRTVSYNGGGLNERFSKITKSVASQSNSKSTSANSNTKTSVFSRLRGAKSNTGRSNATNIQSRLGKTIGGGIKKKPTNKSNAVKGVEKQAKSVGRVAKKLPGKKPATKKQAGAAKQSQKAKKPVKKPTAEDLDKALDAYMMKDPKTAQAKLDAELTSYMDEASELLTDEENM